METFTTKIFCALFTDKKKSSANMFEFCDVQVWKSDRRNNTLNKEKIVENYQSTKFEKNYSHEGNVICDELITPDDCDDISVVDISPLDDPILARAESEELFLHNKIKITNPIGNATWESGTSCEWVSRDPFEKAGGKHRKKRGRPRKNPLFNSDGSMRESSLVINVDPSVKKPIGRPRKYPALVMEENKVKRPIGRPRKSTLENDFDYQVGMDIV